jgi:hypothetical protein
MSNQRYTPEFKDEAAELILARRIEEVRQAKIFGVRPQRSFREAATKFLDENVRLGSIGNYAMHLKQLDPLLNARAQTLQ